jgi:hypothetical protein
MMIKLDWIKPGDNDWYTLEEVQPHVIDFEGVFVIWQQHNNTNMVIRVGQGHIGRRLGFHQIDPRLTVFTHKGRVLVTWAILPPDYRPGVERYLTHRYQPTGSVAFPLCLPIAVHLPFVV